MLAYCVQQILRCRLGQTEFGVDRLTGPHHGSRIVDAQLPHKRQQVIPCGWTIEVPNQIKRYAPLGQEGLRRSAF